MELGKVRRGRVLAEVGTVQYMGETWHCRAVEVRTPSGGTTVKVFCELSPESKAARRRARRAARPGRRAAYVPPVHPAAVL